MVRGMAAEDLVWHGPRVLTKVRQVCIPVELLRELKLDVGSEIQFALSPSGDQILIRPTGRSRASSAGNQKGKQ
jgi:bifunctional DNA-binding transcriptional regulator/antitoxin component of YhaV-PrlF toxin-antitoxin module